MALSDVVAIQGFQLFGIALPIFALACVGLVVKSRFPLALASHLSFACAALLVLFWQTPGPPTAQASLVGIAVPSGAGLYVLATILGSCLLSFAVSHLLYIRAARAEM
ncbi:hypothetical protein [Bradyrhizobium jicamae]|uniref:hypothetical protein n=1 Tax=Bradyrhizobium jicamae TaxID=280332 RepID=UPI001BA9A924|nr:hypothetical protein [Bradyrhizobium jicamae]MBR0939084.1 hypothetical protein [Bradyrhizobium jicamae]